MNVNAAPLSAPAATRLAGRPFRFVLLCHQRSGSNALSAILNDEPRIHLYGQLFNHFLEYRLRNARHRIGSYRAHPEAMRHFGRRPPLRPRLERAALTLWPTHGDLGAFMDRFWKSELGRREQPLEARGFKLHDFQLSDDELQRLATRHADGVVMLWRRNLLKAAVSWAYAIKTDVWSARRAVQTPVHMLDPEEIGWFIDKTRAEVDRWRALLTEAGANMLELTYEDDVVTREIEPLYRFLGVAYPGKPEFRTKRLSRDDYAHVSNARDLERRFAGPDTGSLFG